MQSNPSWKEFQRLASMTPVEVQAADALMNAAVADYRLTRSGVVTMPLADLAPTNPFELRGMSREDWVVDFLRKARVACVPQGGLHRTIGLCLADTWSVDSDAQQVRVRCSMLAMVLFGGEAAAAAA